MEDALVYPSVTGSKQVFEILEPLLADLAHEEFWVLYLNQSNKVIHKSAVSKGGITATLVDVRLILKKALELNATGIILSHNHPSGRKEPSEQDKTLTNKIKKAAEILDINLLDHIIVAEKSYFSFADEGLLS